MDIIFFCVNIPIFLRLPMNQRNKSLFENKTVQSSLLIVWKNEDRGLFNLDMTSLTKTLILKHMKHDTTAAELSSLKERCEQILPLPCTLFDTFVQEINFEILKAKVTANKRIYTEHLIERYPEVKGYSRILDTYALNHAAAVIWFEQQKWGMHEMVDAEIQNYFLGTCLPWLIDRINREQSKQEGKTTVDHSRLVLGILSKFNGITRTSIFGTALITFRGFEPGATFVAPGLGMPIFFLLLLLI
jgi:hypothetical protein